MGHGLDCLHPAPQGMVRTEINGLKNNNVAVVTAILAGLFKAAGGDLLGCMRQLIEAKFNFIK